MKATALDARRAGLDVVVIEDPAEDVVRRVGSTEEGEQAPPDLQADQLGDLDLLQGLPDPLSVFLPRPVGIGFVG